MKKERGELKHDAALLKRHVKDALQRGVVKGRVYTFDDFGAFHAQSLRNELNEDASTKGRFRVRKSKSQFPGHRDIVVKR